MKIIKANDKINYNLNVLKYEGYKYIIKANDKIMSYWGEANKKIHIQLIAVKTYEEAAKIMQGLEKDRNEFNYINCWSIDDKKSIINSTRNKSYTIRNDWTRYNANNS